MRAAVPISPLERITRKIRSSPSLRPRVKVCRRDRAARHQTGKVGSPRRSGGAKRRVGVAAQRSPNTGLSLTRMCGPQPPWTSPALSAPVPRAPGPWTGLVQPSVRRSALSFLDNRVSGMVGAHWFAGPRGAPNCAARDAWRKTRRAGAFVPSAERRCPRHARSAGSRTSPPPSSAAAAASLSEKPLLRLRQPRPHLARIPRNAANSR